MAHFALLFSLLITVSALSCSPEKIKSIRLEEFTRGTQRSIEVDAEKTVVRINETEQTTKTDSVTWKELKEQIQDLPLQKLDKVLVTNKKHQFDGALAASLSVATTDTTYTSPTFDHNAPPAELKAIVDRLYRQVPSTMRERFGQ